MKIEITRPMLEAYALGYFEGRAHGEIQSPRFDSEPSNLFFKQGYDAGVSDFCSFDMDNLEINLCTE
jgi:hypothetical protein